MFLLLPSRAETSERVEHFWGRVDKDDPEVSPGPFPLEQWGDCKKTHSSFGENAWDIQPRI